jgi:hypothetical protein
VARANEAEREIERTKRAIDEAVANVLRSEAPVGKLLADAKALQEEVIAARVVLRHLHRGGFVHADDEKAVFSFLFDTFVLPSTINGQVEHADFNRHPANGRWSAAVEALHRDADAELPL